MICEEMGASFPQPGEEFDTSRPEVEIEPSVAQKGIFGVLDNRNGRAYVTAGLDQAKQARRFLLGFDQEINTQIPVAAVPLVIWRDFEDTRLNEEIATHK